VDAVTDLIGMSSNRDPTAPPTETTELSISTTVATPAVENQMPIVPAGSGVALGVMG
jgi:hypothetical protein